MYVKRYFTIFFSSASLFCLFLDIFLESTLPLNNQRRTNRITIEHQRQELYMKKSTIQRPCFGLDSMNLVLCWKLLLASRGTWRYFSCFISIYFFPSFFAFRFFISLFRYTISVHGHSYMCECALYWHNNN